MLHQQAEFLTGFRSLEIMGLCKISIQKIWGILILVEWWVLGRKETRTQWQFCTTYASLPPTPGKPLGVYFAKNITFDVKGLQWLKLWGMIVHTVKFRTCKVLEVHWIFVGFNKIFVGSVFSGYPVQRWYVLWAHAAVKKQGRFWHSIWAGGKLEGINTLHEASK